MLLLVASAGFVAYLSIGSLVCRIRGERRKARRRFRRAFLLGLGYMFVLLVVSMTGNQRDLAIGAPQCFGDWCATITRANRDGTRGIVGVSVHNQGTKAHLAPSQPRISVLDLQGRQLALRSATGPALDRALGPGETFTKEYEFDIPSYAQFPVVWLSEGGWVTRFLIDGVNSFLHPKAVTLLQ